MPDRINILLVDDEQKNLDALEAILENPEYRLLRAQDADGALHALLQSDVAAIVLDMKMPGVSGVELAQLIKGSKKYRQIPIVFLTAYMVDERDIVAGYDAGAVDYLTKPVKPEILRHKVAVFADLFRKTRALAELNAHLETRVHDRTAELEQSEARLRAAATEKDRFLATLAHELRNPLAPLRTGLDLLLRAPEPPVVAKTLVMMNRQLDQMVRLVNDLVDVARVTRGTLEIRREPVDLRQVVEWAIEGVQPLLARRRQSVVVDGLTSMPAVVDGARITQVVGNLLHNASKHSPQGASIRVELRSRGNMAEIRVADEGAGIPAEQLARVFDMFTKIARPGMEANDGLGIGLALARQLASLHEGTLTAASPGEDKGATFTLAIPTGKTESAPRPTPSPSPGAVRPGKLRVVVVEDNEDSADMLSTWLEHLGHEVRVARTGPDGVALVLDARPDVVLCDLGLPGMDGVAVCREVVRGLPTSPVMVALTGWGMEGDRKRTGDAGFHHHLVKPVELDKLRAVLESVALSAVP